MHNNEYIAESIGDEYMQWKMGDIVFISSPTGSGKTTFILEVLLRYLASRGGHILYLVNRSALKYQLEVELKSVRSELRKYITIESYQKMEKELRETMRSTNRWFMHGNEIPKWGQYSCVVCDEAHYFLMDSNYNTNTILSYKYIEKAFCNKLCVFISATIDQVKEVILDDFKKRRELYSFWQGCGSKGLDIYKPGIGKRDIWNYKSERNYDYLEIFKLRNFKELSDTISSENGKWLIFVDSKNLGEEIKKDLLEKLQCDSKEVVFATSDYNKDEDARAVVGTISTQNKLTAKVLISTSVLDNGINIQDIELRNLIIMADTETEFIQMLGRKRNDGKMTKLYIYQYGQNHFLQRLYINQKRLAIAQKYDCEVNRRIDNCCPMNDARGMEIVEMDALIYQHGVWLRKLMEHEVDFGEISALFFELNGILVLNRLAYKNLDNLNQFYVKLLAKFEKEEDAFLREQLGWLGKSDMEIDELLNDEMEREYENARAKVIREFEKVLGQELSKEEGVKLKKQIVNELVILAKYMGDAEYINSAKKNDRVISGKFSKALRDKCQIPFIIIARNGKYVVEKSEA